MRSRRRGRRRRGIITRLVIRQHPAHVTQRRRPRLLLILVLERRDPPIRHGHIGERIERVAFLRGVLRMKTGRVTRPEEDMWGNLDVALGEGGR
jgi:hypothetical protein